MPEDGSTTKKEHGEGRSIYRIEWKIFLALTFASLLLAAVGHLASLPVLTASGMMAALFCAFGVAYGLAKERSW